MRTFVIKTVIPSGNPVKASDYLAERSGLSKSAVKDAMNKGACWVRKKSGGPMRLRRATALLGPGDHVELYYDERLLSLIPPEVECLSDQGQYSVWHKPAGLLAQGTMYGDHCSLLRQAELFFHPPRKVFLVHRIDREASGLMLLAHTRVSAARFSELFRENKIFKSYRAEVLGRPGNPERHGIIDQPLDGKQASTEYEVESYDPERNVSSVLVTIRTGRFHQIRRHFVLIGHPVIGDPRYGKGNKNTEGLKLTAHSLRFRCPFLGKEVEFVLGSNELSLCGTQRVK